MGYLKVDVADIGKGHFVSLNFGQDSPRDRHDQLVAAIKRLNENPQDIDLGQQAAVIAWSLCDWIFQNDPYSDNWRAFQDSVRASCPELNLLQDIANAAKHREITKYRATVSDTQQQGGFSRAFSKAFAQAGLYVIDDHGEKFLLDDLLETAATFWDSRLTSLGL